MDEDSRGLILAGGQARRFGTDKRFAELGGQPLINHAIGRLKDSSR